MTTPIEEKPSTLIFDTSCLCCFARAGRLVTLEELTAGHRRVVARAVLEELDAGSRQFPTLAQVPKADWLERVPVDGLDELRFFANYAQLLGAGTHDIGESSTLAWAESNGAVGIVDDQAAVNAARSRGVSVRGSLGIVANGVVRKLLSHEAAVELVDDLRAGGARFPCNGSGFIAWAQQHSLIPRL